jgi:CRISPR-associated exonuclease Cas4
MNILNEWLGEYWAAIPIFILVLTAARFILGSVSKPRPPALPGIGYTLIYSDRTGGKNRTTASENNFSYERLASAVGRSKSQYRNAAAHLSVIKSGILLTDDKYRLQGKPDMIYRRGNTYLPIELKSGSAEKEPRDSDILQLAVYFRLVEAEYGVRPRRGRLIYRDAMFIIKNNRALRKRLLSTLSEMRGMLENPEAVSPAERAFAKCRYCNCRGTVCGEL